jgi:hypothetical protein
VIIADIDIVFLSHLDGFFNGHVDLEAQHDSKSDIYPNRTIPPRWKLNLGSHLWRASDMTVRIAGRILENMKKMPKSHHQSCLRKLTMKWDGELLVVDVSSWFPMNQLNSVVRHLDGLLAVNTGGVFTHGYARWREAAIAKHVRRPVLMHFFHLGSYDEKVWTMKHTGLWFWNRFGKCTAAKSKGIEWPWLGPNKNVTFKRL